MKWRLLLIISLGFISIGCTNQRNQPTKKLSQELEVNDKMQQVYIEIDDYRCKVEVYQNETTQELFKQLPQVFIMEELNNNEKFCYLKKNLPTSAQPVKQIKTGDIMLFGNNCLVIFYKDFQTQYSYTKIGRITDIHEFVKRLPNGQVIISFYKEL